MGKKRERREGERGQRSEVRDQRSEIRGQRSEVGGQMTDYRRLFVRSLLSVVRCQKSKKHWTMTLEIVEERFAHAGWFSGMSTKT